MTPVDWLIVIVFALSIATAFANGFFVEACSVAGLVVGIEVAALEYSALTPWLAEWIDSPAAQNAVAFVLIAVGIMVVAAVLGRLLRMVFRTIGLGWLDRLAGAAFGVVKGCILVTLVLMALVAFFPGRPWVRQSQFAPGFIALTHGEASVVPSPLGERIRNGLRASLDHRPSAHGTSAPAGSR